MSQRTQLAGKLLTKVLFAYSLRLLNMYNEDITKPEEKK